MHLNSSSTIGLSLLCLAGSYSCAATTNQVAGDLIQFNDNGAWSWFSEERAIVDKTAGILLVGSITESYGAGGRDADAEVAIYSYGDGARSKFVLNSALGPSQGGNDHAHPVFDQLSDGRYIAGYATHGLDSLSRFRVSTNPNDPTAWQPEVTFDNTPPGQGGITGSTTYSSVFQLTGEDGRIYNFNRSRGFDPNFNYSEDGGATWHYGGRVLNDNPADPVGRNNTRPYANYATNGIDEIHFIHTNDHPNNRVTSLYHAVIRDGKIYDSFGNVIDNNVFDTAANTPETSTQVYAGSTSRSAWGSDIELDANGNPYAVFSTQVNNSANDLRYHYARFDGTQWHVNEIAFAGQAALFGQTDYTGNISLDPNDLNTVYLSTNVDPATGTPVISSADGEQHFEIYKGVTTDGGQTFAWTPITSNSSVDNLRPIVPDWDADNTAVVWMRGRYGIPENPGNYDRGAGFLDYDLAIVGIVEQAEISRGQIQYFDASNANTTFASSDFVFFTVGTGQGANDNTWHNRIGFGNAGNVITAGEMGGDSGVPRLKTTVANDGAAGEFDVFAYFWSNGPGQWEIRAGLSADELIWFREQGAEQVDTADFQNTEILSVDLSDNQLVLYQVYLGRTSLESNEELSVFIGKGLGTSQNQRTWYDGIGIARISELPGNPADLDQDGDVDDADYALAFSAFTGPGNGPSANPGADLDNDGDVDDADFGLAFAAFTGPGGSANVPEPMSLSLLGVGMLLTLRR